MVMAEFPLLFQTALVLIVTNPVNILVPAELLTTKLDEAPVTVVVPVTVKANPAAVKVVPAPTSRLPPIVSPTTVAVVAVPERVKLPLMAVVVTVRVLVLLPDKVRW